MLKIKGNVDLKELEKFGFKKRYSTYRLICEGQFNTTHLWIDGGKNGIREIGNEMWEMNEVALNVIYDLIKADLVDKVSDKK